MAQNVKKCCLNVLKALKSALPLGRLRHRLVSSCLLLRCMSSPNTGRLAVRPELVEGSARTVKRLRQAQPERVLCLTEQCWVKPCHVRLFIGKSLLFAAKLWFTHFS